MSSINILLPFESYCVDASKFSGMSISVEPDTKNTATVKFYFGYVEVTVRIRSSISITHEDRAYIISHFEGKVLSGKDLVVLELLQPCSVIHDCNYDLIDN